MNCDGISIYDGGRNRAGGDVGGGLPDGLTQPEQLLFLSLRVLYREYRQKVITRQDAKREKALMMQTYENEMMWHRINLESVRRQTALSPLLADAEKHGCEICKKMCRVLDGRSKS